WGAQTERSLHHFHIADVKFTRQLIAALGVIKYSAAKTNFELGLLSKEKCDLICAAAAEVIDGKLDAHFPLCVFQTGSGTQSNMNANEVISNRAIEMAGGVKGSKKPIHPNDDVNMSQSSNDVIPTVIRLSTLLLMPNLLESIKTIENELERIAKKHSKTLKVGRTHLQDAVPITLGQEFDSYKEAIKKSRIQIENQSQDLKILGIGGTAVGTGITAHPKYKELMVKNLSKLTGIKFVSAKNLTEITNNMNSFLNFSGALRSLAINFLNLCANLKIMNMGPLAGISEISLPEVQAGSSIMPGKVNPSVAECLEMICIQVLGNDETIKLSCERSQFELNVFGPIIMNNLLQSMKIITSGLETFYKLCLKNIQINTAQIKKLFENSLCTATALSPVLGYQKTAEIIKAALKKGITIRQEVLSRKLLTQKKLDKILSV
ncbi:MAG: lyase family protein, partial [Patescibacteria group bacterium]